MTKEITKAIILQEMQDKLKLRDFEPEKFLLSELVVPTYDVGQHLTSHIIKRYTDVITGTGEVVLHTVPDDEKWSISGYSVVFVGGTYTIAGVYVSRKNDYTFFVYLDLTAAQSVSYTHVLPKLAILEPGDRLCVNVDGHTTNGSLYVYVDYQMEEIR